MQVTAKAHYGGFTGITYLPPPLIMKYKVGDKLVIKPECKIMCGYCKGHTGFIEIIGITGSGRYEYNSYNDDGTLYNNCSYCYREHHIQGYWEYNKVEPKQSKETQWTPEPAKYHKEGNWFTETEAHIDGQTMSIEEFKKKATLYRSLAASHSRYFPSK